MPTREDNLIRETYNLQKRRDDLESRKKAAARTAFSEVYEDEFEAFKDILINNARSAFESTEEFKEDIFIDPLIRIIETNEVIGMELINDNTALSVTIDLDSHAGNLELYAEGITFARKMLEMADTGSKKKSQKKRKYRYDPQKASLYWKNVIYGKKDLSGLSPGTEGGELLQQGSYGMTMHLRFSKFEGKAPFWSLVNNGLPQPMSSSKGGTAYPTNDATGFVEISIEQILDKATLLFDQKRDELTDRIIDEIADVKAIENEIARAINRVESAPEDYKTPQVLAGILNEGEKKYLYITQGGRIGLAANPRYSGYKRLPTGGF